MNINESVLLESQSARTQLLAGASDTYATDTLTKVKALFFAVWNDGRWITRKQVAEFYEVPVETIDSAHKRCRSEFESDGVKVIQGNALKEFKKVGLSQDLSSFSPKETIYSPRAVMRMGFVLQDSRVAAKVRTTVLDAIQSIPQIVTTMPRWHIRRLDFERHNNVKRKYFCTFAQTNESIVVPIEVQGYLLPDKMMPDISTGLRFPEWLHEEHKIDPKQDREDFTIRIPLINYPGQWIEVESYQYPIRLMGYFQEFIIDYWWPKVGIDYFWERDKEALPSVVRYLEEKKFPYERNLAYKRLRALEASKVKQLSLFEN